MSGYCWRKMYPGAGMNAAAAAAVAAARHPVSTATFIWSKKTYLAGWDLSDLRRHRAMNIESKALNSSTNFGDSLQLWKVLP